MKRLVLAGAGHAHAQVLKAWAAAKLPGVDLCLVSPSLLAPYSGRVPGWLAGRWAFEQIGIDFTALASAAGARFVQGEIDALDAAQQQLHLRGGAVLGYDLLSLNVGSTLTPPAMAPVMANTRVLALRPLGHLQRGWEAVLAELDVARAGDEQAARCAAPTVAPDAPPTPLRVTAVGGGAAGAESLLAVLAHLRRRLPKRTVHGALVSRSPALLPGLAPGAARAMHAALARAGVAVHLGTEFDAPHVAVADLLLWATGAEAHAWQRGSGLAVSEDGFIRIDAQLRSLSHPNVYAAGDCVAWAPPLPKSGVHAVRMGPVLTHNLRAALGVGHAEAHTPQRRTLALLATADGAAIASYGRFFAHGRWVGRWKDHLDQQFLDRMRVAASPALLAASLRVPPAAPPSPPEGDSA